MSEYVPTGLYADQEKVKRMRETMDVDAAMLYLNNEGIKCGWWRDFGYTSIDEWKEKDIISYEEFGGIVERILLSAMK